MITIESVVQSIAAAHGVLGLSEPGISLRLTKPASTLVIETLPMCVVRVAHYRHNRDKELEVRPEMYFFTASAWLPIYYRCGRYDDSEPPTLVALDAENEPYVIYPEVTRNLEKRVRVWASELLNDNWAGPGIVAVCVYCY
jgi:hypothetical protein